jgi:hypothetical protein
MTTMLDVWKSLGEALAGVKVFTDHLRPPAPEAAIAELEELTGRRLPPDLRALLALHDGMGLDGEIEMRTRLTTVAEMKKWWDFWYEGSGERYPGVETPRFFLELTESDGDAFLVDLDDQQVYFHVRAEGVFGPIASSVSAWLAELRDRLADGRAVIEEFEGPGDLVVVVDDWNAAHIPKRYPRVS